MSRIAFGGFETRHTYAEGFTDGNSQTIDTVQKRSGSVSMKIASGAGGSIGIGFTGALSRTFYARTWFRIGGNPSGTFTLMAFRNSANGGNGIAKVAMNSSRQIVGADGTLSAALATNTWHCAELSVIGNGTTATWQVRLNGAILGATATAADTSTTGALRLGNIDIFNSNNPDIWFDDWAVNDSQGSAQNSWPGATGIVAFLQPISDNAIGANWLLGNGASPGGAAWDAVNNYPPVGVASSSGTATSQIKTNSVNSSTEPAADADVNVQSYTTGGLGSTDVVTVVQGIGVGGTDGAGSGTAELRVASNPADSAGTTVSFPGAPSTFTSGWGPARTTANHSPTVTKGTSPVMRARRTNLTSGGQNLNMCMLGVYVEYEVAVTQTLSPTGIASGEAVGSAVIEPNQIVSPSGIASGEAVGSPIVNTRFISPTGIASAGALGTPRLTVRITVTGIASAGAVGAPNLGKFITGAGGIASGEDLGAKSKFRRGHLVQNGGTGTTQLLLPIMLDTSEAFGTPALGGHVTGAGNIASAAAVGSPTVVGLPTITAAGIPSTAAVGTPVVALATAKQTVTASGIGSLAAYGSPTVTLVVPSLLSPVGIATAVAFGAARVRLATAIAASPELDVLTDPLTLERYVFPVSHSAEDPVTDRRAISYGAAAPGVTVARQQGPGGDIILRLTGTILAQAQLDKLADFNARCDSRTVVYSDYAGNEYEVIITNFDARPVRAGRNPASPSLPYVWAYTLEMHVVAVRAGAYA